MTCTGYWLQKSRNEEMENNNQEVTPDRNHDSQKPFEEHEPVSWKDDAIHFCVFNRVSI